MSSNTNTNRKYKQTHNLLTIFPTRQRLIKAADALFEPGADGAVVISGMMTFGQFESKLQNEILGTRKLPSPLGKSLLASKIIDRLYRDVKAGTLYKALQFRGFGDALVAFFDELGAGLIGPEELAKVTGYARGKEDEIVRLYGEYHKEIEKRGYWAEGSLRKALIAALSDPVAYAKSPTLRRFDEIRLVDIYQFTPYRFELFRRIAKDMKVVIVAPTPDERRRAFGFIVSNLEKFESLADQAGELEITFQEPDDGPLSMVRSRIFDLSAKPPEEQPQLQDRVKIFRCASRYREIEEVGSSIMALKNEKGADWKDFCLVFRDIKPYGPIIEDVFKRYSIPYHFKKGIKLSHNPFIKSLLALFEAIDSGFTRDNVVRIIGSPYFERFENIDIDEAQTLFLKARITKGRAGLWRRKLKKATARSKKENRRSAGEIGKETLTLIERLEKLGRQNRPGSFLEHLKKNLIHLKPNPEPGEPGAPGSLGGTIHFRDSHAYAQLLEILDDMRKSLESMKMATAPLGYRRIKDILLSHIESRDVPEPVSADRNLVSVLNAHDIVGLSFPIVYICGMHEKEFPRYLEGSSFLHETEKKKFNQIHAREVLKNDPMLIRGRRVFDSAQDKWREESLLFYQAVKSAKEQLTLTFCVQELDGRRLARSQFIDDVLEAVKPGLSSRQREEYIDDTYHLAIQNEPATLLDPEERRTRLIKDIFRPEAAQQGAELEERISKTVRGTAQWSRFRRLVDLAAMERARDRYFYEPNAAERTRLLNSHNGLLSAETKTLKRVLLEKGKGRYAPTDLEKFGQCPFRYFAGKLLGLEAAEEPLMEIDVRSRGTLLHEALENFYKRLIKKGKAALHGSPEEGRALVLAAEKAFAECERRGDQGDPLLWKIEKEKVLGELALWLKLEIEDQKKNGFIPIFVEPRFDLKEKYENALPPLAIEIDGDGARYLIGQVDRIDVNVKSKAVRAADYKSGKNTGKYRRMIKRESMGDFSFQPPIYMIFARDYVKQKKILSDVTNIYGGYRLIRANKLAAAYVMTDTGRKNKNDKSVPVDDGAFLDTSAKAENSFIKIVAQVIGKIENGFFPIDPKNCDYCDFAGLCRYVPAASKEDSADE